MSQSCKMSPRRLARRRFWLFLLHGMLIAVVVDDLRKYGFSEQSVPKALRLLDVKWNVSVSRSG